MKCSNCQFEEPLGEDGLCDDCREAVRRDDEDQFDGALCARCDLDLTDRGFCPNDRCPFHHARQDEVTAPWKPPGRVERAYIASLKG